MRRPSSGNHRTAAPDKDLPGEAGGAPSADVDVVIVSYNQRERLRAACESALAGSVSTRVIVVDNHSSDGSTDAVRNLLLPGDLIDDGATGIEAVRDVRRRSHNGRFCM